MKKIKQNEQVTLWEQRCFRNWSGKIPSRRWAFDRDVNDKKTLRNLHIQGVYSLSEDRGTKAQSQ